MTTKRERSRRKQDRKSYVMMAGHRHRKKLNSLVSQVDECADYYRAAGKLILYGYVVAIFACIASFDPRLERELESYKWVFSYKWAFLVSVFVLGVMLVVSLEAVSRRNVPIKRLRIEAAIEKLRRDERPPVLYLRSFGQDAGAARIYNVSRDHNGTRPTYAGMISTTGTTRGSEEDCIAEFFDRVGPVIAIGDPGDKTPFTGAARYYVDNQENWTEVVKKLLDKSAMVILHAGLTEGLLWELETVIRKISSDRLFLLISRGKEKYKRFKTASASMFPSPLPDYSEHSGYRPLAPFVSNVATSINAVITFDADWTPHFILMPLTPKWYKEDGEFYLRETLPEVFAPFLARMEAAGNPCALPIVEPVEVRDVFATKLGLYPSIQAETVGKSDQRIV